MSDFVYKAFRFLTDFLPWVAIGYTFFQIYTGNKTQAVWGLLMFCVFVLVKTSADAFETKMAVEVMAKQQELMLLYVEQQAERHDDLLRAILEAQKKDGDK